MSQLPNPGMHTNVIQDRSVQHSLAPAMAAPPQAVSPERTQNCVPALSGLLQPWQDILSQSRRGKIQSYSCLVWVELKPISPHPNAYSLQELSQCWASITWLVRGGDTQLNVISIKILHHMTAKDHIHLSHVDETTAL